MNAAHGIKIWIKHIKQSTGNHEEESMERREMNLYRYNPQTTATRMT